jgi:corrinoid protein of di/trimethylamine methyltransferase
VSVFDEYSDRLAHAIVEGDSEAASHLVREALDAGAEPEEVFETCVTPTLADVGDRFGRLEIFLPELLLSADAAKAIIDVLVPVMKERSRGSLSAGKVVIGTVAGDIHDIGKNMVATMLEVNGFEVINLGTDVSPNDLLATARTREADVIAMSSLLTTSLPYIKDVLAVLAETGDNALFKVMVGGGPVTDDWAESVGADGYGRDAAEAVEVARKLMSARTP